MSFDPEKIAYIGRSDYRSKGPIFGIKAKDRTRHVYVIGKTGMGKSTLLENMAVQDITSGEGMGFIDPHGGTAEKLLEYVPEHRIQDVVYFAPFDTDYPISFNVMEDVGRDRRHFVVSGLMSAFKKIWVDAWSARMESILSNVLFALLEFPDSTLLGVNRMLVDKEYRKRIVDNITDPSVKSFWVDEFAKYTDRFAAEATPAIQNKVGQFTANPLIRNIIGQPHSNFDFRKMMDEKKILIMNLSKGRIGDGNTNLIGSMLITKIYLAAMSRADVGAQVVDGLPNFYFFVDEFQSFANESFADILSEARKYKLNLTIAHQYIEQMPEEVRYAVFGNVGTMISFRVGAFDAEVLEKEFAPQFTAEDMVSLGFAQVYMKLMIDGISSRPFSATTLAPIAKPLTTFKDEVIQSSRVLFAKSRDDVERDINKWYEPLVPLKKESTPGGAAAAPAGPAISGTAFGTRPRETPVASTAQVPPGSTPTISNPQNRTPSAPTTPQTSAPRPIEVLPRRDIPQEARSEVRTDSRPQASPQPVLPRSVQASSAPSREREPRSMPRTVPAENQNRREPNAQAQAPVHNPFKKAFETIETTPTSSPEVATNTNASQAASLKNLIAAAQVAAQAKKAEVVPAVPEGAPATAPEQKKEERVSLHMLTGRREASGPTPNKEALKDTLAKLMAQHKSQTVATTPPQATPASEKSQEKEIKEEAQSTKEPTGALKIEAVQAILARPVSRDEGPPTIISTGDDLKRAAEAAQVKSDPSPDAQFLKKNRKTSEVQEIPEAKLREMLEVNIRRRV